jgi:hypothetical protein
MWGKNIIIVLYVYPNIHYLFSYEFWEKDIRETPYFYSGIIDILSIVFIF